MGKYSEVIKGMPHAPRGARNDRMEKYRTDLGQATVGQLAFLYAKARHEKKEKEKEVSAVNERIEVLSFMIQDAYEEEGISSLKVAETGEKISVQFDPQIQIDDKPLFRKWCIDNGYENEMTLHAQTANSIMKNLLLEGKAGPDGTSAYIRTVMKLSKA